MATTPAKSGEDNLAKNGERTLQDITNLNKQKKETEKHFLF